MKLAMCHYSLHRRWSEEKWDIDRLTDEVAALGIEGIDYHVRLLGTQEGVVERIRAALERTGLALSGFSLSTNFNLPDAKAFDAHLADTLSWMRLAEELKAPACRVFGGSVDRSDPQAVQAGLERVLRALRLLAPEAERMGLVLALENHGGLPCTGEEQAQVIEAVGSPAVRATVDVGNYMQGGQSGVEGTRVAARYAAYVHVKDNKILEAANARGRHFEACTIGDGVVDIPACLRLLRAAGFDDFVALEYEGTEPEETGVPRSVEYMKQVVAAL
ncbi:MAG: sugar phosphate isomerase/epimerase family protein [Gemmatimonadota bacterium]